MSKHKLADRILSNYDYRIVHHDEDTEEALFGAVNSSMDGNFPLPAKADLHAVLADLWPNYAAGLERRIAVRIAVRDWRGRYQRFDLDYQQNEIADETPLDQVEFPEDGIAALIGGA